MSQTCSDPDPYAELDYRADAGELSEEFRRPSRLELSRPRRMPVTGTSLKSRRSRFSV